MVGGCSLAMVLLSPKLCLFSFATFPAAVLLSRHMGKRIKARQRAVQEALAAAAAEAHSALLNVRTLRLFAAERLASERYDERVRAVEGGGIGESACLAGRRRATPVAARSTTAPAREPLPQPAGERAELGVTRDELLAELLARALVFL